MMNFSQKDARWRNMGVGLPMKKDGCYVTSLSMIVGKTPDKVLNFLMVNDCFNDNCELINAKAASILGFKRYQELPPTTPVTSPIITETNYYASIGYPKHFFISLPNGEIVDPLTGLQGSNKYAKNIVSYRLFA